MISLADIIKAKEASSNGSANLENIYLALIKLEWSSSDLTSNLNNTNLLLSSSISSSSSSSSSSSVNNSAMNNSDYAIVVKDSGLIDESLPVSNRHFVDQKESVIMQTLKLLCKGESKANAPYQGPYAYIPGIMGSQEHISSKYAAYAELILIVLIFSVWIFSIWLCFYRYSRLRTLQPGQPRYNFDPLHINQVRIVKNERDGMIILKKKPSHFSSKGGKISGSGYLNTTSSSKTSLLMHPYLNHQVSCATESSQQKPPLAPPSVLVEPLIVVDTVNEGRITASGGCDDDDIEYDENNSPSHSRSFSEPHVVNNYGRLFHKSVPAYTTSKLHPDTTGQTRREYSQYSQYSHQSQKSRIERYHTINTSSLMTTTNAALISEHHQFYHMSQPQPQQQQQKQHEHRPRAARLTKQAPVQLNVTPPPPDRERELSLKAVLHRVTDRRSMYAKSKLSFKRLLTHRVSQGDVALNTPSIALESLDIGGGGGGGSGESPTVTRLTTPIGNATLVSSSVSTSRFFNEKNGAGGSGIGIQETEDHQLSNINISNNSHHHHHHHHHEIDTNLLDPHRIPIQVRKSLLDMHYHLHQKPPLLQTSRISKSDSNIKVPPFLEKNKKMLSLQKSSYD